jgi:group I intron endonuclease
VGSSIDIHGRWRTHKSYLLKGKHHSIYLQRSWNKYGQTSFLWVVLEQTAPIREIIVSREQFYLDLLCPAFNTVLTAASMLGFKFSKETKQCLSAMRKGRRLTAEWKQHISTGNKSAHHSSWIKGKHWNEEDKVRLSEANKGKKRSPETCQHISEGKRGYTHSEETKRRLSEMALTAWQDGEIRKKYMANRTNGHIVSEETRQKMSLVQKERWQQRISLGYKAKPVDKDRRLALSLAGKAAWACPEKRQAILSGRKKDLVIRQNEQDGGTISW